MNLDINIQERNLADLKPAEYNPRQDLQPGDPEYEKIKRSIETFGYVDPIIINADGTIIGGHQRYKVLRDLGKETVKVSVVDVDKDTEKALNIALNKTGGDWDMEKLKDLLKDLDLSDIDVTITGFDGNELKDIIGNVDLAGLADENFDENEVLARPAFSKEGDIWHLGRHTVICGDSTDPDTYKRLLGDQKVNLVLTDPPYLVSLESSVGTIKNDDLDDEEGYAFLKSAFDNFKSAMAKDASIYIFYATMKARVFYDAYEDAGFKVGAGLIWKKPKAPFMRTDWKFNMEPIIWGWRKDGKHIWYGDQKQLSIFEFDGIKNAKEDGYGHPSSKPVLLLEYLMRQCTQTNGVVLDGFLGSASTLIACEEMERVCRGVELEPKYVDVAVERFRNIRPDAEVYVERDGETINYEDVEKSQEDE